MGAHKKFRQGQILKVLTGEAVVSQDELRRQLIHLGVRVTQATLSRDLRELRLVKTVDGYKPLAAAQSRRIIAGSRSGAGPEIVFARYPSGAKHAGAENSSRRRAAARGRGGLASIGKKLPAHWRATTPF